MTIFKTVDVSISGDGFCFEASVQGNAIPASTQNIILIDRTSFSYGDIIRSIGIRAFKAGGTGAKVKFVICSDSADLKVLVDDIWNEVDISAASTNIVVASQSTASITKYGLYNSKSFKDYITANSLNARYPYLIGLQFSGANIPNTFTLQYWIDGMKNTKRLNPVV